MEHVNLETERFLLKILTPEIVGEEYLSWFSNEEASQHIYYAKNKVTLDSLKSYVQEKLDSPQALFFGIFEKQTSKHIGNIKYEPVNFQSRHAVMGVLIGDNHWRGKGVFSEIDKTINGELLKLNIEKVYLGVDKDNQMAIKAYLKSGYAIDSHDFLNVTEKNSITMLKDLR